MTQNQMKINVSKAALAYLPKNKIIGIGTGTTINYFIDLLADIKHLIAGAVASSIASAARLKSHQIPVFDLNAVDEVALYVDGADSFNSDKKLIKGGGGALTREKIIANTSRKFLCIVDGTKKPSVLGSFPIPVEVIPMARTYVSHEIIKLGGEPIYRKNFITDNGNIILDIKNLVVQQPIELEQKLNNIAGVVCNGIFGMRGADAVLIGHEHSVEEL